MEWVVITGSTVTEARERALDHLGVDDAEVEIEVLDEPGGRLFWKTDARVRARIVPRQAPARRERRRGGKGRNGSGSGRGGRRGKGGGQRQSGGSAKGQESAKGQRGGASSPTKGERRSGQEPAKGQRRDGQESGSQDGDQGERASSSGDGRRRRGGRGRGRGGQGRPATDTATGSAPADGEDVRAPEPGTTPPSPEPEVGTTPPTPESAAPVAPERPATGRNERATEAQEVSDDEMQTLEEQVEVAEEFLEGLVDAFGLSATIERNDVDDELVELQVLGDDLGLLIGRRGSTVQAVNEVLRTGLQRRASGTAEGRVRADIGRYRERRREALARFAAEQAAEVIESGEERALEPMNSADRKVVHDAINEIDGVETLSEGAEPRRWVVIAPID
ncbi:MAG: R3H domain-containing nucleic acid-binding protein [Actinomycetota bacterium]